MPFVNEKFEYQIPEIIKKKISEDLLLSMKKHLDQKFNSEENDEIPTFLNFYVYLESTKGWGESFKKACVEKGLEDVLEYYSELEWYNSDMFDDEISLMMVEQKIIEEGKEPEVDDYLKK